jgi:hypothetical protein
MAANIPVPPHRLVAGVMLTRIIRKRCVLSLVDDGIAITEWPVARFGKVETQGPLSPVA